MHLWKNKFIPAPDLFVDYNRSVGGVDMSNGLIGTYSVSHRTMKWYKTFFSTLWFYDNTIKRVRKHCKRCSDAGMPRAKASTYCRRCEVPLCFSNTKNCFQLWHDER